MCRSYLTSMLVLSTEVNIYTSTRRMCSSVFWNVNYNYLIHNITTWLKQIAVMILCWQRSVYYGRTHFVSGLFVHYSCQNIATIWADSAAEHFHVICSYKRVSLPFFQCFLLQFVLSMWITSRVQNITKHDFKFAESFRFYKII